MRVSANRRTQRRPISAVKLLGVAALIAVGFASCESVFTTSPLAFLQRDPSTLSPEQQVSYGEQALASGDPDAMAEAYETLKESDDPQTQLLAADLALGASEVEGTITQALAGLQDDGDPEAVVEEALAGFDEADLQRMQEAADLLDSADESVTPTAEQYALAAVGVIAVAASENEGDLSATTVPVQAEEFLTAAYDSLQESGESTDLLEGIGDAAGWSSGS